MSGTRALCSDGKRKLCADGKRKKSCSSCYTDPSWFVLANAPSTITVDLSGTWDMTGASPAPATCYPPAYSIPITSVSMPITSSIPTCYYQSAWPPIDYFFCLDGKKVGIVIIYPTLSVRLYSGCYYWALHMTFGGIQLAYGRLVDGANPSNVCGTFDFIPPNPLYPEDYAFSYGTPASLNFPQTLRVF